MKNLRWLGLVIIIVGIGLVVTGNYIYKRATAGEERVNQGQDQLDNTTGLFSFVPFTQEITSGFTESDQGKINQGRSEVTHYRKVAAHIHLSGVIVTILGAVTIALSFFKRNG